jgi:hypothetical protein
MQHHTRDVDNSTQGWHERAVNIFGDGCLDGLQFQRDDFRNAWGRICAADFSTRKLGAQVIQYIACFRDNDFASAFRRQLHQRRTSQQFIQRWQLPRSLGVRAILAQAIRLTREIGWWRHGAISAQPLAPGQRSQSGKLFNSDRLRRVVVLGGC